MPWSKKKLREYKKHWNRRNKAKRAARWQEVKQPTWGGIVRKYLGVNSGYIRNPL